VDKELKGHRFAGVAGACQEEVIACQPAVEDLVALHLQQRLTHGIVLARSQQDVP
jgi:hypothetical protein